MRPPLLLVFATAFQRQHGDTTKAAPASTAAEMAMSATALARNATTQSCSFKCSASSAQSTVFVFIRKGPRPRVLKPL